MRYARGLAVLAALVAMTGTAYAASSTLVPPDGRVDGRTYEQWLVKFWRVQLGTPNGASRCQPVGDVEVILGHAPPYKHRESYECSISSGSSVYIPSAGAECSTIEKPPFYSRTPRQLRSCAKKFTKRAFSHIAWTIDGVPVEHPGAFVTATRVFRFRLAKHNLLHIKKRSGRAAAYGGGVLLQDLALGQHVVERSDRYFGSRPYTTTYRIDVQG
jgi:hypothetical protein